MRKARIILMVLVAVVLAGLAAIILLKSKFLK